MTKWGPGNPVVYGELDAGADKTLLVYFMYDTMPVLDEGEWVSPPFEGRIIEQPPFEKVLVGRGAVNSKGPQMAMLCALASIKEATGGLPVNLKFVCEGDEERMSIGLHKFVHDYKDELSSADALIGFGSQTSNGVARLMMGSEGCLYVELETSGERWGRGPAKSGIHGLFKRVVDSPAWRHVKMLSTLVSDDGNRILVDGWYDDIAPVTDDEREMMRAAAAFADPDGLLQGLGIDAFIDGLSGDRWLEESLFGTTLNLDGIWGGLTTSGTAGSLLPHKVTSKHNCRYVPNQRGDDLLEKLRRHLDRHGYDDVEIRVIGDVPPVRPNYDTDIAGAVIDTFEHFDVPFVKLPQVGLIGLGPYWPAYLFADVLGVPVGMGGLGHGGGAHSINEYWVIEGHDRTFGMAGAEKGYATIIYKYLDRASR
jgi:acetylornithine deacetylase/succinyl-diaminopimelate desuccinylase-like protein